MTQTGSHSFKFRFGIQGGTNISGSISSIKLGFYNSVPSSNITWANNTNVDLENLSRIGIDDRVSARYVNNELRLTKYGLYHYGMFTSMTTFNVNKEDGKSYKMNFSGITFSNPQFTCKYICIMAYKLNDVEWMDIGTFDCSSTNSFDADFTGKLTTGNNSFNLAIRLILGSNDVTVKGYVDISQISLSIS